MAAPWRDIVLSTTFMVTTKLYLYMWTVMFQVCLGMSCQIISGHWSFQLQTWKAAKYNLNFLSLPRSDPLTFSRLWLRWPLWPGTFFFLFLFFVYLANRDGNPRRRPSSLGLWWTECIAAPLIAVMALRAQSQTIRMLTSPPLMCTATSRRKGGRGGKGEEGWGE